MYIADCSFKHIEAASIIFQEYASIVVTITNTEFVHNGNGILLGHADQEIPKKKSNMVITDTIFRDNTGISLGVAKLLPVSSRLVEITLKNVMFINNTNLLPNAGIVQVDGSVSLSIEDFCEFRGNRGSSIQALTTTVNISGVVSFEDNVAFQGGAISLSFSTLELQSRNGSNTHLSFMNNSATRTGGGIYVDRSLSVDSYSGSYCFFNIQGVSFKQLNNSLVNLTLVFKDNSAEYGGVDIFGATPNSNCSLTLEALSADSVQRRIFKTSSSLSSVSSDPKRVCLCEHSVQLACANLSYIFFEIKCYRGEVFSLSLALVGFDFGTITGPVYANLLPQANSSMSSLGSGEHVRQVGFNTCTPLNFTIHSLNSKETIVLTTNNTVIKTPDNPSHISDAINSYNNDHNHVIPYPLLTVPVYLNITILDCPPGFKPTNSGGCECAKALNDIGIRDCFIYNNIPSITRRGSQWIQPISNPDGILASRYCPFNYCKEKAITIIVSLNDSDKQCDLHHTGILCGACPSNLSLAIGSSRCLECDYFHTLLLIAFAAAGILLVMVIWIIDVTVTTGTINGLLFYANVIWANQSILFPPQNKTSPLLQFLKTFIAWLNLDLGIQTCFIPGLNGYWKTWLQFVFPVYIWLIAGLIIIVSHYSTRATKILGNNSAPVLATLFLLCYAKLLRTILIVLEFTVLEDPNGQRNIKWSFDGYFKYFGLEHSFLFAVAMVVLLGLWLPYMFALLFIQCLRRYSHYCMLRWVNKLYPLFDSYLGPLKVKHQYWIGLGLLARLVLLLISTITLTTTPFLATLVIGLTTSLLCLLVLDVYKQWQLSILEGCFLVNMAMFSCSALFIEAQGGQKDSLVCISLGIAFIFFLGITAYHVWRKYRSFKRQQKNSISGYEDIDSNIQTQTQVPFPQQSYQEESVTDLREPLLDSST